MMDVMGAQPLLVEVREDDRLSKNSTHPAANEIKSMTTVLHIAAFSDGNTGGNPAGVWIGDALPDAAKMQAIAAEGMRSLIRAEIGETAGSSIRVSGTARFMDGT